jgi:hypothetical protein
MKQDGLTKLKKYGLGNTSGDVSHKTSGHPGQVVRFFLQRLRLQKWTFKKSSADASRKTAK